jgi:TPR repeat protein
VIRLLAACAFTLLAAATRADSLYPADKAWVLRNYDEAIRLYRAAALAGDVVAQRRLGDLYSTQTWLEHPNPAEAARWYAMAATSGDDMAEDSLALLYRDGDGVTKNEEEAVRLLRHAASRDNYMAQYHLGQMYRAGSGVQQDYLRAYMWFSLGAGDDAADIAAARDEAARFLSPKELKRARQMAAICQISNYLTCDQAP